tara:strand:+ start:46 stop:282 length:237 start_codon:yes stop_codon:yes gene_type:complete
MRRINVTLNNVRITKSFINKEEFIKFIVLQCFGKTKSQLIDDIWNLDMGKSISHKGIMFSIQSKQRVGNQLYDGSTIN